MNTSYSILTPELLAPGSTLKQLQSTLSEPIKAGDPAERVYTDLTRVRPFTVSPTTAIDQVNDKMIACAVRLLFVVDSEENLHGLVTYSDLFGDRPVRYIQEHGGKRNDILAQDVMTPLLQLEALRIADVQKASVGNIVETIKAAGRQHLLVCARGDDGRQTIIGLFSSTHIEKLVGIRIELSPRAQNFADLERALN